MSLRSFGLRLLIAVLGATLTLIAFSLTHTRRPIFHPGEGLLAPPMSDGKYCESW
jgi:hypothetical protein